MLERGPYRTRGRIRSTAGPAGHLHTHIPATRPEVGPPGQEVGRAQEQDLALGPDRELGPGPVTRLQGPGRVPSQGALHTVGTRGQEAEAVRLNLSLQPSNQLFRVEFLLFSSLLAQRDIL